MKFYHNSVGETGYEFDIMGYKKLAQFVDSNGFYRKSRLGDSSEFVGAQIIGIPYLIPVRHGYARRLGIIELLQVLSAYFDERHIEKAAPKLLYSYGLTHAYGIKIAQQLENVIEQLKADQNTRRAMIYIGKPEDGYEIEKPCVQNFQFIAEGPELNLIADIRSWDLVSGFPYDYVVMSGVLQIVSQLVGLMPGLIIANVGSAHIYKKDSYKIDSIVASEFFAMQVDFDSLRTVREWAMDELNNMEEWKTLGAPKAIYRKGLRTNEEFIREFIGTE